MSSGLIGYGKKQHSIIFDITAKSAYPKFNHIIIAWIFLRAKVEDVKMTAVARKGNGGTGS